MNAIRSRVTRLAGTSNARTSYAQVPFQRPEAGVEYATHELLAFFLFAFLSLEFRRPFAERAIGIRDGLQTHAGTNILDRQRTLEHRVSDQEFFRREDFETLA